RHHKANSSRETMTPSYFFGFPPRQRQRYSPGSCCTSTKRAHCVTRALQRIFPKQPTSDQKWAGSLQDETLGATRPIFSPFPPFPPFFLTGHCCSLRRSRFPASGVLRLPHE